MRYRERGDGPAVLLLHGLGTTPDLWGDVVPVLAERMRTVALDLTDQDMSEPEALARRIRGLLLHLGIEECAAVGHGMGGVVAQWLALEGGIPCMVLIDAGRADPSRPEELSGGSDPDPSALARLDVPTLVLWGEDDPFLGVDVADALAQIMPLATLVLLPGCGHFLPVDAPETVAALASEFLRARYLGLPHHHDHAIPAGPVPVELRRAHGSA